MPREYTILVRSVRKITDAAAARGVGAEELYGAVDLDPALLGDPDNRITFAQFAALYENAARLTGDDAFGLHVGETSPPELFDVLGYVIKEGTSHQDLLDEVRSELSRRYLQEPELAICEVAYLLGFSEPSAFHRAFRRWTGVTPKAFRMSRARSGDLNTYVRR